MKLKIILTIFLFPLTIIFTSCGNNMQSCIESYKEMGYSSDEAWANCEEGMRDSQARH